MARESKLIMIKITPCKIDPNLITLGISVVFLVFAHTIEKLSKASL